VSFLTMDVGYASFMTGRTTAEKYERIAPLYDLLDLPFELGRYRSIRPLLFRSLSGRLLDAGVGTGRNIAYYPPGSEVVGIDLSPAMLQRASRRKAKSSSTMRLMEMDLTELEFPDGAFDAAVASFVFCTMPAEVRLAALRSLARVVRPGGRVRLLEYAPARTRLRRVLARAWQPWAQWAFGANLAHDIEPELAKASLNVTRSRYVTGSIKLIEAATAA
jgi:ubiquinone/menaquinone biosynthesis C-methylase UbiE